MNLSRVPRIVALLFLLVLAAMLLLGGFAAISLPPLQLWHNADAWQERFAYDEYTAFADYLDGEQRWVGAIFDAMAASDSPDPKYTPGSLAYPDFRGKNWNASFSLPAQGDSLRGGVLLVHGLSDSPYHMRAVAEIFAQHGYYVISLRLPGHGTVPGALVRVSWRDWAAAVDFAARMLHQEISSSPNAEFIIGGFSTGGALTLRYTLKAILDGDHQVPDKLFLFSPAVAITKKAILANWHKLVAWLPFYEKFRWESIEPETDPFKYNSFPKNAADQIHLLTQENQALAVRVRGDVQRREQMPPIFAYQSPVDATVISDALVQLFRHIGNDKSELVMFDINHAYAAILESSKRDALKLDAFSAPQFRSQLFVVSNYNQPDDPAHMVTCFRAQGSEASQPLSLTEMADAPALKWPPQAFALSHVCIPIRPDDPYYGQHSLLGGIDSTGTILAGERGVLAKTARDSLHVERIRFNPFFAFMRMRIEHALGVGQHDSLPVAQHVADGQF